MSGEDGYEVFGSDAVGDCGGPNKQNVLTEAAASVFVTGKEFKNARFFYCYGIQTNSSGRSDYVSAKKLKFGFEGNTCCKTAKCADYRGTIAVTEDGHTCKDWVLSNNYKPSDYPNGGLIKNYCRNPRSGTDEKAWCNTNTSWGWCDIPQCKAVNCGKYGVPSEKCKCSWHKCRFWPHRPSDACGCPWGYCREDRPKECKAETPNPHDLKPTSTPNKCGDFGVATKDCQCDPGNCRADRPSSECGCPWGQCDQRRPYHCKWRGTEDHHHHHHHGPPPPGPGHHHHHHGPPPPGPGHHHHHHGPPPHHHHHHHHHSGSSESRSSESRSSESRSSESRSSESWESQEDNHSGKDRPDREDNDVSDRLEMVLNGAMGFLLCSLGFLLIITIYSLIMKRVRAGPGPSYRNLAAAPVEFVRNPTEYVVKKPEDKEGLIQ